MPQMCPHTVALSILGISYPVVGIVSKRGAVYVTYHPSLPTGPSYLFMTAKTGKEPFLICLDGFPAGPTASPLLA